MHCQEAQLSTPEPGAFDANLDLRPDCQTQAEQQAGLTSPGLLCCSPIPRVFLLAREVDWGWTAARGGGAGIGLAHRCHNLPAVKAPPVPPLAGG